MEIIINNVTFTLLPLNSIRRKAFVENILSNYNYEQPSFDAFMEETRKILEEKHKIIFSLDQVKKNFLKSFNQKIIDTIWLFIHKNDKIILKTKDNIVINSDQIVNFIENYSNKVKEYVSYVKNNSNNKEESEDIIVIYSYLSKCYGWTFEQIEEMDELQLLKAIEQAIISNKTDSVNQVNLQSLSGAFVSGNKKAKSQIDKMNRDLNIEVNMKKLLKVNPNLKAKTELTREQLQKIMEAQDVRRS